MPGERDTGRIGENWDRETLAGARRRARDGRIRDAIANTVLSIIERRRVVVYRRRASRRGEEATRGRGGEKEKDRSRVDRALLAEVVN